MSSIAALELEAECLRDELQSLKADARLKNVTLTPLTTQSEPWSRRPCSGEQAARIGKEIRMRYLEEHRLRMNLKVTAIGHGLSRPDIAQPTAAQR
jgi:hypothetical protein